jgi:3-dehydro-4-phosphotetronate decarboxylase
MNEAALRDAITEAGHSLFARGYAVGTAGNISARLEDGYLITPTNASLGMLDPARIAKLDAGYRHVGGDKPSKEVFMHRAFYQSRPQAGAVAHLHSTMATAIACLAQPGERQPIPPLTPYFVMRIGRALPVVAYFRPGDPAMEPAIAAAAAGASAVLLANHGPVVSAATLRDAVAATEELEEAAKLTLLLRGAGARALTPAQVDDLLKTFG